jgi:hypothetical protein
MESIELDCPPGSPRPGDLIDGVIAGTGLPNKGPGSKFFGNWTWYYDIPRDEWESRIQPIIEPRIKQLLENGSIRYGSW